MSERDLPYELSATQGADSLAPASSHESVDEEWRPRTNRTTKITATIVAFAMLAVIAIPAIAMLHRSLGPLGAITFLLMVAVVAAFMRTGLRDGDRRRGD